MYLRPGPKYTVVPSRLFPAHAVPKVLSFLCPELLRTLSLSLYGTQSNPLEPVARTMESILCGVQKNCLQEEERCPGKETQQCVENVQTRHFGSACCRPVAPCNPTLPQMSRVPGAGQVKRVKNMAYKVDRI